MDKYCGFIALIGRPNVGKSTLLNALLKQKVSITSHRPQTTRHQICGIKTIDNKQMIYVDTPGIHSLNQVGEKKLNQYMNQAATRAIQDVDCVLFLIEAQTFTPEDELVLSILQKSKRPIILVINKVDKLRNKENLLPIIERLSKMGNFAKIVPISAMKRLQVDVLEKEIMAFCPEGPFHYPEETICNRSDTFRLAECVREKIMRRLEQEVPYATSVQIEALEVKESIVDIHALIWVEKLGQKTILIGEKGTMLKQIGIQARLDMEKLLGKKVMLKLWVKVKNGWSNNRAALSDFGLAEHLNA
jgi:GTPase